MAEHIAKWFSEPKKYVIGSPETHIAKDEQGRFRLRLNERDPGVVISDRFGRLMQIALKAQEASLLDEELEQELENINCHKTVLYLLGIIGKGQLLDDSPRTYHTTAEKLSDRPFTHAGSAAEVRKLAEECTAGNRVCVGQVAYDTSLLKAAHSFVVGASEPTDQKTERRPNLICFEKSGHLHPFQVRQLESIVPSRLVLAIGPKEKRNPLWRFIPIDDIK